MVLAMVVSDRISTEVFEAKRWPYYLLMPISSFLVLWVAIKKQFYGLLGKRGGNSLLLFDGIGEYGKVIKRNVTGWRAVDLIYNHRFGQNRSIGGCLDDFWFNSLNCQAARNRFKLAKRELEKAVLRFSGQEQVRILSLAAGTGQIETETIAKLKEKNIPVKAILVDREPDALKRAHEFISLNGVSKNVEVVPSDVKEAIRIAETFKPHIIQMVAFLDYLQHKEAVRFISTLFDVLPSTGYFITSNTMPNIEMYFVKHVVGWPLIYRSHDEIRDIIKESGFPECEIINEPLCIQNIVVARKNEHISQNR